MSLARPAVPCQPIDLLDGWEPVPGTPDGVEQKMLTNSLDEVAKAGGRTRLIRFRPGTLNDNTFVHDYWEEFYLVEGDLEVDGLSLQGAAYACRPPGTPHGPFYSRNGCIFFESQYYL
ncbi:cupin domain-containing protein [Acuticoccus kandeliae]|uniref:cupin domain-containing protein n=1 Tax=Acuticoccus kandeliae TaxID=2073160 RepID=UPI000D3ED487|nr:cupin domain-containing protein [Acuticoccus kandeliae]